MTVILRSAATKNPVPVAANHGILRCAQNDKKVQNDKSGGMTVILRSAATKNPVPVAANHGILRCAQNDKKVQNDKR